MTTGEIRDRILEQRTIYQQSVLTSDREIKRITETIASLDSESLELVKTVLGNDYSDVTKIDLARVKSDKGYAEEWQKRVDLMISGLHGYLEGELNV